jgi:hypothetical protein
MKTYFTVGLSKLAGGILGAGAIQGLHAQAKPVGYVVAEIDVKDSATMNVWLHKEIMGKLAANGGKLSALFANPRTARSTTSRSRLVSNLDGSPDSTIWMAI